MNKPGSRTVIDNGGLTRRHSNPSLAAFDDDGYPEWMIPGFRPGNFVLNAAVRHLNHEVRRRDFRILFPHRDHAYAPLWPSGSGIIVPREGDGGKGLHPAEEMLEIECCLIDRPYLGE